jgi:FkbM family methyltransferase
MVQPWFKRTNFWRLLQHLKQSLSLALTTKEIIKHTYCEEVLKVAIEDPLAKGWYGHDWPMLSEIRLLRESRLKHGALVFDLGGHQGVVGMILAKNVGEKGKIIIAEPNPHNFKMIQKNLALNKINNVIPLQIAIGGTEGSLEFSSGLNGTAATVSKYGITQRVPMTTMDQLVKAHGGPQVVFLDIEGFEELALKAGKSAFNGNCDFFVEVHVNAGLEAAGGSVVGILDFFPPNMFERYVHHDNGMNPIKIEEAGSDFFKTRFFLTALAKNLPAVS